MTSWLQQSFYVTTQDTNVSTITKITSTKLSYDIIKLCRDKIQEESMKSCRDRNCKPRQELGNKDDSYVVTK